VDFKKKIWDSGNKAKHIVVQVDFSKGEIQQAKNIANLKAQYINVHNPGGIERSEEIIRNRIVAGKLADSAVLKLLTQAIVRRKLLWQISEYDQVRTDGFRNHDLHDLLITYGQGSRMEIEIRSSFSYRLMPEDKIVKNCQLMAGIHLLTSLQRNIMTGIGKLFTTCDLETLNLNRSGLRLKCLKIVLNLGRLLHLLLVVRARVCLKTIPYPAIALTKMGLIIGLSLPFVTALIVKRC
jgi:hypothetical protein